MVFAWRNDPWIISRGTSGKEVSWKEHSAWFASTLDRTRHLLFIILSDHQVPAGTVRVDRVTEEAAVLAIYLLEAFTGRGLGPRAIEEACQSAFAHWPLLKRISAQIQNTNRPSIKAFARTGFQVDSSSPSSPQDHVVMVRSRE
jgi:RimJ/RimL family protein N-acetyltransferase